VWQKDILVLPDDLIAFDWSAPMRDLAAKLDLSDVGLKKLLTRCGVASPPQGYKNKIRAGKRVPALPKAPPRRPGELGRATVDARFKKVLSIAAPLASNGPFASALIPEELDELLAQELKAIGKASVPQTLDRPHKGLVQLLRQEQRRRDKNAEREWTFDEPTPQNTAIRIDKTILDAMDAWARRPRADAAPSKEVSQCCRASGIALFDQRFFWPPHCNRRRKLLLLRKAY
jgi:hypothetical protein